MSWVITFYGFYMFGETMVSSTWNEIVFRDQQTCMRYLVENKEYLEKNATEYFSDWKANGKTYVLEGYNLECDPLVIEADAPLILVEKS